VQNPDQCAGQAACPECAAKESEIELLKAALTIAEHRNEKLLSKLEEHHGQQRPTYRAA
jgi:hypothetical protein